MDSHFFLVLESPAFAIIALLAAIGLLGFSSARNGKIRMPIPAPNPKAIQKLLFDISPWLFSGIGTTALVALIHLFALPNSPIDPPPYVVPLNQMSQTQLFQTAVQCVHCATEARKARTSNMADQEIVRATDCADAIRSNGWYKVSAYGTIATYYGPTDPNASQEFLDKARLTLEKSQGLDVARSAVEMCICEHQLGDDPHASYWLKFAKKSEQKLPPLERLKVEKLIARESSVLHDANVRTRRYRALHKTD